MKKAYAIILAVVACVLAADLIYMGSVFVRANKKITEPVASVAVQGNEVSYSAPVSETITTVTGTAVQNSTATSAGSSATVVYDTSSSAAGTSVTSQQTGTAVSNAVKTSYTLQETIAAMQTAVNYAKSAKNFTGKKVVTPSSDTALTDISLPILQSPANAILKKFLDNREYTFTFVNGFADDVSTDEKGDTVAANDAIQPEGRYFELYESGIASYSVSPSGNNTVYTVKLIPETATLNAPDAYYHSMVIDCFDLSDFDISPAQITSADIHYAGSTVTVVVDTNGLPVSYTVETPAEGTGNGSLLGLSASGTLKGTLTESWSFTF